MSKPKLLLIVFLPLFILSAAFTVYFGIKFFKAYQLGSDYVSTLCVVERKVDSGICDIETKSECYEQNDGIWWYNSWGANPYIIIINGGGGNGYYPSDDDDYDDDDDGEYDDDDDDGGEDDDEDGDGDTGDYDDDDGGDDDDDDDGGDIGGDIGGDDDLWEELKRGGGGSVGRVGSTSGAADLTNVREFKGIKKSLKDKLKAEIKLKNSIKSTSNNTSSSFDGSISNTTSYSDSDSGMSMGSDEFSGCSDSGCYQGIFYVNYNISDSENSNRQINSTINGLVSVESDWVKTYLNQYSIGSNYTCWYDSKEPNNVIWFKPPKVRGSLLAAFIIFGINALIWGILSIVMIAKIIHHYRHHHHHGYRSINH